MDEVVSACVCAAEKWRSVDGHLKFESMIRSQVDFDYKLLNKHRSRLIKMLYSLSFQSESEIDASVNELADRIAQEYEGQSEQTKLYKKITTNPIGDMPAVWVGKYDRNPSELEISNKIHGGSHQSSRHMNYMESIRKYRK